MQKNLVPLFLVLAVMVFACQKEKEPEEKPVPEEIKSVDPVPPDPVPPAKLATVSIASVQMLEDCPDPKPASPAAAPAKRRAPAESRPASMAPPEKSMPRDSTARVAYTPPCQQSTVQFAFAGQGAESSKVVLKELRLLAPDGKDLATLKARLPSQWKASVYTPWNEVLQPESDLKASYKITPPEWSEVEAKLGGRSHGSIFVLEAVIEIDGEAQTARSSQFTRIQPQMMPT